MCHRRPPHGAASERPLASRRRNFIGARLCRGFSQNMTGAEIYLDLPTVTGTENLMMAAVLAEGRTVLHNVAREPEITALADVLNLMGADISGSGSSTITINGVKELHPVTATIIPDRIETGTFMVAAALTGGEIVINT